MGKIEQNVNVCVCLDGRMPPKAVDCCLWGESLPGRKEGGIPACSLLGLWKQLKKETQRLGTQLSDGHLPSWPRVCP